MFMNLKHLKGALSEQKCECIDHDDCMAVIYENVYSVLPIGDSMCCLLSRVSSVNIIVY